MVANGKLGTPSEKDYVETIAELAEIPGKMEKVLEPDAINLPTG